MFLVHFRGEVGDLRQFSGEKYVVGDGFEVGIRWFGVGFLWKPDGDLMIPCC